MSVSGDIFIEFETYGFTKKTFITSLRDISLNKYCSRRDSGMMIYNVSISGMPNDNKTGEYTIDEGTFNRLRRMCLSIGKEKVVTEVRVVDNNLDGIEL